MEGKGILHRKSEEWGGEGRRFGKVVETSDRVETSKRHSRWSEQTTIATKCHVLYMSRGKLGRAAHHPGQKLISPARDGATTRTPLPKVTPMTTMGIFRKCHEDRVDIDGKGHGEVQSAHR